VKDVLLLVDVVNDFQHDDGEALLRTFRARHEGLVAALDHARASGISVVYANDDWGRWDGNAPKLVRDAIEHGPAGGLIAAVQPQEGDRFILKRRYSAFDSTPLAILLEELGIERILLAGMATEMCVAQTAIAAREQGYKVTVLADACAYVDADDERIALAYLERVAGARIARSPAPLPPLTAER
jgi:nicotinamidase-related amidase